MYSNILNENRAYFKCNDKIKQTCSTHIQKNYVYLYVYYVHVF